MFVVLSGLFVAAALWKPSDSGIPLCGFKLTTGRPCPGCGMTRALTALGRGEPGLALKYHAFAPFVALAAVAWWITMAAGFVTGRDYVPNLNDRRLQLWLLALIVVFIGYWLVRLWMGTAP